MVKMIRKQIHIEVRGLNEAEWIRQAFDHRIGGAGVPFVPDTAAWEEARAFMLELCSSESAARESRQWRREDLYEERIGRYSRHRG